MVVRLDLFPHMGNHMGNWDHVNLTSVHNNYHQLFNRYANKHFLYFAKSHAIIFFIITKPFYIKLKQSPQAEKSYSILLKLEESGNQDFKTFKIASMMINSDSSGQLNRIDGDEIKVNSIYFSRTFCPLASHKPFQTFSYFCYKPVHRMLFMYGNRALGIIYRL